MIDNAFIHHSQMSNNQDTRTKNIKIHRLHTWTIDIEYTYYAWHMQSGAGYVYMDCLGLLSLSSPCLFRCPSTTACWNSGHSMLLFKKSWPINAMFGLMVFMFM